MGGAAAATGAGVAALAQAWLQQRAVGLSMLRSLTRLCVEVFHLFYRDLTSLVITATVALALL